MVVLKVVLVVLAIVLGILAFATQPILGLSVVQELGVGLAALGVAVLL